MDNKQRGTFYLISNQRNVKHSNEILFVISPLLNINNEFQTEYSMLQGNGKIDTNAGSLVK